MQQPRDRAGRYEVRCKGSKEDVEGIRSPPESSRQTISSRGWRADAASLLQPASSGADSLSYCSTATVIQRVPEPASTTWMIGRRTAARRTSHHDDEPMMAVVQTFERTSPAGQARAYLDGCRSGTILCCRMPGARNWRACKLQLPPASRQHRSRRDGDLPGN